MAEGKKRTLRARSRYPRKIYDKTRNSTLVSMLLGFLVLLVILLIFYAVGWFSINGSSVKIFGKEFLSKLSKDDESLYLKNSSAKSFDGEESAGSANVGPAPEYSDQDKVYLDNLINRH